jgi:hypothetical protein
MSKYTLKRPTRASGDYGPYEQGYDHGAAGDAYENIYDQPGEECDHASYQYGWIDGSVAMFRAWEAVNLTSKSL